MSAKLEAQLRVVIEALKRVSGNEQTHEVKTEFDGADVHRRIGGVHLMKER